MPLPSWFPHFRLPVWLMVIGRFLSQTGTGFTLFFAPIYFVNQVGLSATQVGIGLASVAVAGTLGRVAGGTLSDNVWGRRPTLLLSLWLSGAGSVGLAASQGFNLFVIASMIGGLGDGLYWPSAESIIADLATPAERNEAFALNRLADSVGNSVGVFLAGAVVIAAGNYRLLFIIDAVTYLIFFAIVLITVQETRPTREHSGSLWTGWGQVWQDRALMLFVIPNSLLTLYVSQLSSALPLYLNSVVGLGEAQIGTLFAVQGGVMTLAQMPLARRLNQFTQIQGLLSSAILWAIGFSLILVAGIGSDAVSVPGAVVGLIVIAFAMMTYYPSASSLVVELSVPERRGIYFSVNSLCWAAGYMVGPAVGGAVMDLPQSLTHTLWLGWILSTVLVLILLSRLSQRLSHRARQQEQANPVPDQAASAP